jgi:hypothetical protein
MLKLTAMLAFGALVTLTGCASMVSLHPLAPDEEAERVDLSYVGLWKECAGDEVWRVERKGDRVYGYFQLTRDGDRGEVRLLDLEGTRFADMVPEGGVVPAHLLAKVHLEGDTLYLAFVDEKAASKALPHEIEGRGDGQQVILTASTADLRKYLLSVRHQPGAFEEEAALCRVK